MCLDVERVFGGQGGGKRGCDIHPGGEFGGFMLCWRVGLSFHWTELGLGIGMEDPLYYPHQYSQVIDIACNLPHS